VPKFHQHPRREDANYWIANVNTATMSYIFSTIAARHNALWMERAANGSQNHFHQSTTSVTNHTQFIDDDRQLPMIPKKQHILNSMVIHSRFLLCMELQKQ
jgi:hypothetical protein